jgi:hypothetical protein
MIQVDDLWPYLRMRMSSDQYAEVLQANPGLAGILDDTNFSGPSASLIGLTE